MRNWDIELVMKLARHFSVSLFPDKSDTNSQTRGGAWWAWVAPEP